VAPDSIAQDGCQAAKASSNFAPRRLVARVRRMSLVATAI
jgi:hypothetical protein